MGAPRVTPEEERIFGKDPLPVRQSKYAEAILRKKPNSTVTDLKESLEWKFGKCVLKRDILVKMVG